MTLTIGILKIAIAKLISPPNFTELRRGNSQMRRLQWAYYTKSEL